MPNRQLLMIGAGVALVGLVAAVLIGKKAAAVAGEVGQAVNPLNHDNVFAAGVNAAGAAVSGDADFTLGGWLYDVTHAPLDLTVKPAPDPFDFGNPVYSGVNAAGAAVTGDSGFSVGGWLYDAIHAPLDLTVKPDPAPVLEMPGSFFSELMGA